MPIEIDVQLKVGKRSTSESMNSDDKQLANPFSTGGGGSNFENQVQAAFTVLMLTGGIAPCLPPWPIKKIKLQGRYAGYQTDDFIIFVEERSTGQKAKLLAQIKHTISIRDNDPTFGEVIQAAWSDFRNNEIFNPATDKFALISGPLSAREIENTRTILEWARHTETATEFINNIQLTKFSSNTKRSKLQAFRSQLKKANNEVDLSDDELWRFLKSFHLLGYDLDIRSGVTLSLLLSHISQFTDTNISDLWAIVAREVSSFNQNAGTISPETIPQEIRDAFSQRLRQEVIPEELVRTAETETPVPEDELYKGEYADAIMLASLLGSWNDKVEGDRNAIKDLIEGHD
jgi:hypothetical protein